MPGFRSVSVEEMVERLLNSTSRLMLALMRSGEEDEAMRQLAALAKTPAGPDYGQLRNDPAWAGLRSRADFQAMLAGLDPRMGP